MTQLPEFMDQLDELCRLSRRTYRIIMVTSSPGIPQCERFQEPLTKIPDRDSALEPGTNFITNHYWEVMYDIRESTLKLMQK